MKLSEKILYYRKKAGLSQEELAGRVGVSRQAVSKWELGDAAPEVDKLRALAREFGITVDELLSEEAPREPEQAPPPPPPQPPEQAFNSIKSTSLNFSSSRSSSTRMTFSIPSAAR